MANSFSISNNHYLRLIYSGNTDIVKKSDRENQPSSRLTTADSKALRKGLAVLADMQMDDIKNDAKDSKTTKGNSYSGETQKGIFYKKIKAFADAYNYTIESGTASTNASINKIAGKMKSLSSKNADKLKDYGITFDSNGYMSVKESTVKNMSASNYTDLIGKDSDYNKELTSLAKSMSRHVDIAL